MKRKYNVAKATNRKLGSRQVPPRREVHGQLRPSDLVVPVGVGLSPRRPTFLYWSLPIWIHFLDQSVTLDYATAIVRRQTTHSLTRGAAGTPGREYKTTSGDGVEPLLSHPTLWIKRPKKKKRLYFIFWWTKNEITFFSSLLFVCWRTENWTENSLVVFCVLHIFFLKDWSILWLLLKTNVLPWLLLV